jgi:hypothetical protein
MAADGDDSTRPGGRRNRGGKLDEIKKAAGVDPAAPEPSLPSHVFVAGVSTDTNADHVSVMAMYGLILMTFGPGLTRRFTPAMAKDLIHRLNLATAHAETFNKPREGS